MKFQKICIYSSIIIPFLIIIWNISPFEFTDPYAGKVIFMVLSVIFLILMVILLNFSVLRAFKPKRSFLNICGIVLYNIAFCAFSFCVFFILLVGNFMCGRHEEEVFTRIDNPNIKIIETYVDCGAWDSGPFYGKYKKIIPLAGIFRIKTSIDTNEINKDEWGRVSKR